MTKKNQQLTEVCLKAKHSKTKMDNTVLSTVYNEFVSKAIHARVGTVFGKLETEGLSQSTARWRSE